MPRVTAFLFINNNQIIDMYSNCLDGQGNFVACKPFFKWRNFNRERDHKHVGKKKTKAVCIMNGPRGTKYKIRSCQGMICMKFLVWLKPMPIWWKQTSALHFLLLHFNGCDNCQKFYSMYRNHCQLWKLSICLESHTWTASHRLFLRHVLELSHTYFKLYQQKHWY